ncbi:MAG: hypothetical protein P4L96_09505 [Rhodoferax sp.]|nr:hypothetical protein [Rhodoferax sp.]
MEAHSKNVPGAVKPRRPKTPEEVKHLTLRLPSAPDAAPEHDESAALTRLRALTELLTGQRHTIHAILCTVIETAQDKRFKLPVPKSLAIPTGQSFERLDVRLTQRQLDLVDTLRDQLPPQPDMLDFREYYGRPDVVRELLKLELARVESLLAGSEGRGRKR